jgi:uncharacterized repeat protein (TIGR01451 family)
MHRRLMILGFVFLGMLFWFGAAVAVVQGEPRPFPQIGDATSTSLAVSEPWLVVSPTALFAQVPVNEQVEKNLTVGNRSLTSTLAYTITALWGRGIIDWLDVTPTHGILPTDSVTTVDVTFDATNKWPGYLESAILRVSSNSPVAPAVVTVPVSIEVIEATVVPVVTPTSLSADLLVGATAWQTLTLGNQGNATMLFTLTVPSDPVLEGVSWLDLSPPTGTVPAGGSRVVTATFDAAAMLSGTYQTNLTAHFNSQVTPAITVPVSMTVIAPAYYRGPIYSGSELDYQPSIIRVQPGGRLLVVFERFDPATFSGDLYATYSDDGGGSWSEPVPAIDSALNERHPSLVQLADSSFVLFYLVDETGAGAYRIHRATSSDGVAWIPRGGIDLGWSMSHQVNPNVIREADSSLTITYHRYFTASQSSGPSYIARSMDDGATWDTLRTQVSDSSAALPRLAKRESDGLYIVTYQVNPGGDDLDLYAKISTDPYDWAVPQIPVSTDINTHDSQPIVLEDGTFLVVYAMTPINYFDLFYRISCDGVHWSDQVQVTDDPAHFDTQPHPLLHGMPGHVILIWSHQLGASPYQDHDVWIDNDLPLRSSLCGSSKTVQPLFVAPGLHPLTYTLVLPNIGQSTAVSLVDPVPGGTEYQPGSLWASGGHYGYDATLDVITWTGGITTNGQITLRFQVSTTLALTDGAVITNSALFTDATGMAYRAYATALVDALPRSLILDPQGGQFISKTTYLISGVATDTLSGIASVAVSVDGGDWHPAVGQETWTFQWLDFDEGEHNLHSQATDTLGQVEVPGAGISVTVDTTPPELVSVVPGSGMVDIPLDLPVSLEFSEPIERVDFHIVPNPGNLVIAGLGSSQIVLEHRDFEAAQTYTCTVQARDRAFNLMRSVTWSFRAAEHTRVYLPVVLRGLP